MACSQRCSDYDQLAWFYNRHWGAEYNRQVAPILERLVLQDLPSPAPILDVCCGTGRMAANLAARGYEVTGLDGSAQMLDYARQNAPSCTFLLSDAREFRLAPRFSLAISLFESLNHVLDSDGLSQVLANVQRSLLPGGTFVFDLNGEPAFERFWNAHHAIVEPDNVCICRSRYNSVERLGVVDITMFRSHSHWVRSDVTITQRFHPSASVVDLLARAGFQRIETLDAQALGMTYEFGFARTFFVCHKPADGNGRLLATW